MEFVKTRLVGTESRQITELEGAAARGNEQRIARELRELS